MFAKRLKQLFRIAVTKRIFMTGKTGQSTEKNKNHITEFDQNQAWKGNGNQNLTEFS